MQSLRARLFGIDTRTLALYRIMLGGILLIDLVRRAQDLRAHYTDQGIMPRAALLEHVSSIYHWSLHNIDGSVFFQLVLFVLAAIAACALLFGYRTRLALMSSLILLISLHNRNPAILHGGDILLRVMLFWSCFLPLNEQYSIDRSRDPSPPPARTVTSLATAVILLQVGLLYLSTALLKHGPEWVSNGKAAYYALSLDSFVRPFGQWLLQFPEFLQYSTLAVLLLELFTMSLLFFPYATKYVRLGTICALVVMHVIFGMALNLGLFPWIDILALTLFLPPVFWTYLAHTTKRAEPEALVVFYDQDCGFCLRMVRLVTTMLCPHGVNIRKAQHDTIAQTLMDRAQSWVVRTPDNKHHTAFDAWIALCTYSPLCFWLAPIFHISLVHRLGTSIYYIISRSRSRLAPYTRKLLSETSVRKDLHPLISLMVMICSLFVGCQIIAYHTDNIRTLPDSMRSVLQFTGLNQTWAMFAPYPTKVDGWYVTPGVLETGQLVDVQHYKETPPSYDKPTDMNTIYINNRWRKFLMNMRSADNLNYREQYAKYLCRTWNNNRTAPNRLETFQIDFMKEVTTDTGVLPLERITLWEHHCIQH